MFRKDKSIKLKGSTSPMCNNLSVLVNTEKNLLNYAVIHKQVMNIVTASADGTSIVHRQIVCKDPTATHGSTIIMQSKWIVLPSRTLLVLTSLRGIQMFEADGSAMVYWHALGEVGGDGPAAEQNNFGRGIGRLGYDFICIGTQKGNILVFTVPVKGSNITLRETLKAHKFPITDISSEDNRMVSADDDGNIIMWRRSGDSVKKVLNISGSGSPCNSIGLWKGCIAAAYGSGHIRLFSADQGCLSAEVTAHARTINSLDIAKDTGLLVSAGEDSFVRVWKIIDGNVPHIEYKFSDCITDVQLMGSRFIHGEGKAIVLSGYDNNDLTFFVQCS